MNAAKQSAERIALLQGCSCSPISVHPADWNQVGAEAGCTWYIHYRFYDPTHKKKRGKQVVLKSGVNNYSTLAHKRQIITALLEREKKKIIDEGWNPVRKVFMAIAPPPPPPVYLGPVHEQSHLQLAVLFALKKKWPEYRPATAKDVFRYLRRLRNAAKELGIFKKPISEFRRRDLLLILDQANNTIPWTPHTWNKCLGYLGPLFKKIRQYDAMVINPTEDLDKRKTGKPKRQATTDEERTQIKEHLARVDPDYGRMVEIFFHSGAREIELIGVQAKDVDIARQGFWVTIYKGRNGTADRVFKTIKDEALPLWIEAMASAGPEDYIFGLKRANTRERLFHIRPATQPMTRDVFTRRWAKWVKSDETGLGIKADAYSLKHSHTTKLRAINAKASQDFNSHASDAMNAKHYDLLADERKHDALRGIAIPFAMPAAQGAGSVQPNA